MKSARLGFDRAVRLEWVDALTSIAVEEADRAEARSRLMAKLQSEIEAPEALKKTVLVLLRVWYPETEDHQRLRDEALSLALTVDVSERRALYWGLTMVAYPFFRDIAALVGKLSRLQPAFSAAQVRRRVIDEHGDTALVERARRHVVHTLLLWGVIRLVERNGTYQLSEPLRIGHPGLQEWLLEATLLAAGGGTRPLEGATNVPELFPWNFVQEAPQLARNERFDVRTMGDGRRVLALASSG